MIESGLPPLLTKDEAINKFGSECWQDKTEAVMVRAGESQQLQLYLVRETKKRPRSSLSPMSATSPSSKRLVATQKQLRSENDLARKLQLLAQYRDNDEYDRIDALIDKWREVVLAVVETLWQEAMSRDSSLTRQQFLAALQLGKKMERLVTDEDGYGEGGREGEGEGGREREDCP